MSSKVKTPERDGMTPMDGESRLHLEWKKVVDVKERLQLDGNFRLELYRCNNPFNNLSTRVSTTISTTLSQPYEQTINRPTTYEVTINRPQTSDS